MGGVISGERGSAVPSLLQNREVGRAKANTSLIKIIIGLNKVKEEIKTLWEVIFFFTRNLKIPSRIIIGFLWPVYILAKEEKEGRRKREDKRARKREKERRKERKEKRGRY